MRAKFQVRSVTRTQHSETLELGAVCGDGGFGANGESEDNTYARYSPSGELKLQVTNPDLFGKINPGEKYYLDFTLAPVPEPVPEPLNLAADKSPES